MAKQDMNEMQLKFCEMYVECGNGKESAIAAGYSEKSAVVQASKMLTMPKIKKEIARLRELQGIDTTADKDMVIEALLKMINDPKTEPQHMLTAVDKLSRLMGWLKEGIQVEVNQHSVERISDADLEKRMAQLEKEMQRKEDEELDNRLQ